MRQPPPLLGRMFAGQQRVILDVHDEPVRDSGAREQRPRRIAAVADTRSDPRRARASAAPRAADRRSSSTGSCGCARSRSPRLPAGRAAAARSRDLRSRYRRGNETAHAACGSAPSTAPCRRRRRSAPPAAASNAGHRRRPAGYSHARFAPTAEAVVRNGHQHGNDGRERKAPPNRVGLPAVKDRKGKRHADQP